MVSKKKKKKKKTNASFIKEGDVSPKLKIIPAIATPSRSSKLADRTKMRHINELKPIGEKTIRSCMQHNCPCMQFLQSTCQSMGITKAHSMLSSMTTVLTAKLFTMNHANHKRSATNLVCPQVHSSLFQSVLVRSSPFYGHSFCRAKFRSYLSSQL